MHTELHAIFKGHVQGIGFRWTILDHAEAHHLTGTVRNLPNGTVEVFAQGSKETLEAFIETVKNNPGSARITSIQTVYRNPTQFFSDFRIAK